MIARNAVTSKEGNPEDKRQRTWREKVQQEEREKKERKKGHGNGRGQAAAHRTRSSHPGLVTTRLHIIVHRQAYNTRTQHFVQKKRHKTIPHIQGTAVCSGLMACSDLMHASSWYDKRSGQMHLCRVIQHTAVVVCSAYEVVI